MCVHNVVLVFATFNAALAGVDNLPNKLVSLVDHLSGGEVVGGKVGVLAGGPLDAGQLLLGPGHEHHEAHSAGHIGGGDDGLFRRSSGSTHGEETEAEDESFENQKDQKICQIQCENF